MSDQLFSHLKAILRTREMTYADVAERMGVSEVTIKRIFADKDCKLSRLSALCQAVGVDLHELIEVESQAIPVSTPLQPEQSRALAKDRSLLGVFMMLVSRYQPEQLQQVSGLTEPGLYHYLRRLETLELIDLNPVSGDVSLRVETPVDFVGDKHLARVIREVNESFLGWVFDHKHRPDYAFETLGRHLTRESAQIIMHDLEEIVERMQRLALRDSLMAPKEHRRGYKLTAGFGLAPFDRLFTIEEPAEISVGL